MMIIVTGGAGFIGSNLVKALNERRCKDILVVDNLSKGEKFRNLVDCDIADYADKDAFLAYLESGKDFDQPIQAVFHQGACSTTTEWDGRYMLRNNYEYSKILLHYCLERRIPFIYASSASVYGQGRVFKEGREQEAPLNVYGYSKFLFDQYVRQIMPRATSQIVGLRYFNVAIRDIHQSEKVRFLFRAFHVEIVSKFQLVRTFCGCPGTLWNATFLFRYYWLSHISRSVYLGISRYISY